MRTPFPHLYGPAALHAAAKHDGRWLVVLCLAAALLIAARSADAQTMCFGYNCGDGYVDANGNPVSCYCSGIWAAATCESSTNGGGCPSGEACTCCMPNGSSCTTANDCGSCFSGQVCQNGQCCAYTNYNCNQAACGPLPDGCGGTTICNTCPVVTAPAVQYVGQSLTFNLVNGPPNWPVYGQLTHNGVTTTTPQLGTTSAIGAFSYPVVQGHGAVRWSSPSAEGQYTLVFNYGQSSSGSGPAYSSNTVSFAVDPARGTPALPWPAWPGLGGALAVVGSVLLRRRGKVPFFVGTTLFAVAWPAAAHAQPIACCTSWLGDYGDCFVLGAPACPSGRQTIAIDVVSDPSCAPGSLQCTVYDQPRCCQEDCSGEVPGCEIGSSFTPSCCAGYCGEIISGNMVTDNPKCSGDPSYLACCHATSIDVVGMPPLPEWTVAFGDPVPQPQATPPWPWPSDGGQDDAALDAAPAPSDPPAHGPIVEGGQLECRAATPGAAKAGAAWAGFAVASAWLVRRARRT